MHDGHHHNHPGHRGHHSHGHGHAQAHGYHELNRQELTAFIRYTLQHNEHHGKEFENVIYNLDRLELFEAGDLARECLRDYQNANRRLAAVLEKLGE